jgi:hypothetical protein
MWFSKYWPRVRRPKSIRGLVNHPTRQQLHAQPSDPPSEWPHLPSHHRPFSRSESRLLPPFGVARESPRPSATLAARALGCWQQRRAARLGGAARRGAAAWRGRVGGRAGHDQLTRPLLKVSARRQPSEASSRQDIFPVCNPPSWFSNKNNEHLSRLVFF